jgi:hypothetical protein
MPYTPAIAEMPLKHPTTGMEQIESCQINMICASVRFANVIRMWSYVQHVFDEQRVGLVADFEDIVGLDHPEPRVS